MVWIWNLPNSPTPPMPQTCVFIWLFKSSYLLLNILWYKLRGSTDTGQILAGRWQKCVLLHWEDTDLQMNLFSFCLIKTRGTGVWQKHPKGDGHTLCLVMAMQNLNGILCTAPVTLNFRKATHLESLIYKLKRAVII